MLDELAIKHGTDKSSKHHDYMRIYEPIMQPVRQSTQLILEIGIGYGASARMWLEYFPNAVLFVIDNDPAAIKRLSSPFNGKDRIRVIQGDQSDPVIWESLQDNFDFIIDDGSHIPEDQITSVMLGFSHLKLGGYWFIEDTHCNFHPNFSATDKLYPWLMEQIINQQCLPSSYGNFYIERDRNNLPPLSRMIYGIRSYKSMIILEKAIQ